MLGRPRRALRKWLPRELRLRARLARRAGADIAARRRFACSTGDPAAFPFAFAEYTRPFIDYPGQADAAAAKRTNQQLMACAVDGVVIRQGEVFSLWRLVGRPTAQRGYRAAAAIVEGQLGRDVGGATCLFSTTLYNTALLGGMRIEERRCHSVDSYGDARYFELGRDAAIEYGYLDLRFANPHAFPVLVQAVVDGEMGITTRLRAPCPVDLEVELDVSEPESDPAGGAFRVRTFRRVRAGGRETREDLGWSVYRVP